MGDQGQEEYLWAEISKGCTMGHCWEVIQVSQTEKEFHWGQYCSGDIDTFRSDSNLHTWVITYANSASDLTYNVHVCALENKEDSYLYGLHGFAFWWFRFTWKWSCETESMTSGNVKFEQIRLPQFVVYSCVFERNWETKIEKKTKLAVTILVVQQPMGRRTYKDMSVKGENWDRKESWVGYTLL